MELLAKNSRIQSLTIFARSSILDFRLGSESPPGKDDYGPIIVQNNTELLQQKVIRKMIQNAKSWIQF